MGRGAEAAGFALAEGAAFAATGAASGAAAPASLDSS
jgi:hypothetical protein